MPRSQRQMMHGLTGRYPSNWVEIARTVKDEAGWKCERCGHPDDAANGYMLTTAHLVPDKSLCERWNLAALCQRCHLRIQGKVDMPQGWMFDHSEWMKPHVEGYKNWSKDRLTGGEWE